MTALPLDACLLSLIIPVRKSYAQLATLIATFDDAVIDDYEIIVVHDYDDPPPPNFSAPSNIRIVVAPSLGLGRARNFGLSNASGRYVAFCDSDDAINLNVLCATTREMEAANCDLALSSYNRIEANGGITYRDPSGGLGRGVVVDFADRARMSRGFYFCWNKIHSRAFLHAEALLFPSGEYEDVYWSVSVIARSNQIYVSDQPYYGYRRVDTSAVNRAGAQHLDIIQQYGKVIADLAQTTVPAAFLRQVWMQATRHVLFVICKTNRLERGERKQLFHLLLESLRQGPGLRVVLRAPDISQFNKCVIGLRCTLLLELKRLLMV